MILESLEFFNYCQYRNYALDFKEGLSILVGKNGAGKSNLLNAIFFSLTGKSCVENKTRAKMLKWKTTKGSVELKFRIASTKFTAVRNLHNSDDRLKWDKNEIKGMNEVSAKLQELLRTDATTLQLTSFMPQIETNRLILGTDIERQKEYCRLFKLAGLEKSREVMRQIASGIETYPDQRPALDRLKSEMLDLDSRIQEASNVLERRRNEASPMEQEYKKYMESEQLVTETEWKSRKLALEKEMDELEQRTVEQMFELDHLPPVIEISEEESGKAALYEDVVRMGRRYLDLSEELSKLPGQAQLPDASALEAEYDQAFKESEKCRNMFIAAAAGECPTCYQKVASDDKAIIALQAGKLDAEGRMASLKTRMASLKKERDAMSVLAGRRKTIQESVQKMEADIARASAGVEGFDYQDFLARKAELTRNRPSYDRMAILKASISSAGGRKSRLEQSLDLLLKTPYRADASFDLGMYRKLVQEEIPGLEASLKVMSRERELLTRSFSEKECTDRLRQECDRQRAFWGGVRDALHVDRFPRRVISIYRPRLGELVNKYLRIFSFPFHVSISETLECKCLFPDNPDGSVFDLSGGQRVALTIAFRLAVSELFASSIHFIILDEPTNHMDADSRKYLGEVLSKIKGYLRSNRLQMLVSTHDLELTSIADQVVSLS